MSCFMLPGELSSYSGISVSFVFRLSDNEAKKMLKGLTLMCVWVRRSATELEKGCLYLHRLMKVNVTLKVSLQKDTSAPLKMHFHS